MSRGPGLRRTLSLGASRAGYEIRLFFRSKESVFFTFLFPVMFLILFSLIFSGKIRGTDLEYSQVLTAGILAAGVASVTFVNLAVALCIEREQGTIKRLSGTPLPVVSYFLGKLGMVLVTGVCEVALILGLGTAFFHVSLPSDPGRWLTFAWVFLLGLIACTLIGISMSGVPKDSKSAGAVVNIPFVALQMISGVFVNFSDLPGSVRGIASLFPLKWMAQGFRSVLLPDYYRQQIEPGGSWQHGPMLAVLLVWCVVGGIVSVRTFRWRRERGV